MKVEIEIPDPKFQVGDVLRYGPGNLILYVKSRLAGGEWSWRSEAEPFLDWDGDWHYETVVQTGGGITKEPIRPGTNLGFRESTLLEPEDDNPCETTKIEWGEPIIEGDTMENLGERWKAWKKKQI